MEANKGVVLLLKVAGSGDLYSQHEIDVRHHMITLTVGAYVYNL